MATDSSGQPSGVFLQEGAENFDHNWKNNQQRVYEVDVPTDNNSLFWAVTLAYLTPVRDNNDLFLQRYEALFGGEESALRSFTDVKESIQNYNSLCDRVPDTNQLLKELIHETLPSRVVSYMLANRSRYEPFVEGDFDKHLDAVRNPSTCRGEAELRAISEMLSAGIDVSGATTGRYGNNGNTRIQLFHAHSEDGGGNNHYNFGLEQSVISHDLKRLMDEIARKIRKYEEFGSDTVKTLEDIDQPKEKLLKDILQASGNIVYLHNKLGDSIKLTRKSVETVPIAEEALMTYKDVHTFYYNILGNDHEYTLCILSAIAYCNNVLGTLKTQENPSEALRHHNEALNAYEEVCKFQSSNLGKKHALTLSTLSDMAYTNNKLGRLKSKNDPVGALQHYMTAYEISEGILKRTQEPTLDILNNLGYICSKLGELKTDDDPAEAMKYHEQANQTFEEALEIQIRTVGKENENTVNVQRYIANTNSHLADLQSKDNPKGALKLYEKACQLFKEVHEFQTRILGKEHERIVNVLNDIAKTNNKLGGLKSQDNLPEAEIHYEEASEMYRQVVDIHTKTLGREHKHTLNALLNNAYTNNNLADLQSKDNATNALRLYEKACQIFKEVHEIQTRTLGEEHEHTLKALQNNAHTNMKLGKLKSPTNPQKSLRYYNLEKAIKHYKQALEMFNQVLEIRTRTLGREAEQTVSALRFVAMINDSIGRLTSQDNPVEAIKHFEDANQLFKEVVEIQRKTLDKEEILKHLRSLAYVCDKLGGMKLRVNKVDATKHYEEAYQTFLEVLDIETELRGRESEHNINTRRDLAFTNNKLGQLKLHGDQETARKHYEEALKIYKEILEVQTKTLGEEHYKTRKTAKDVSYTESCINRLSNYGVGQYAEPTYYIPPYRRNKW